MVQFAFHLNFIKGDAMNTKEPTKYSEIPGHREACERTLKSALNRGYILRSGITYNELRADCMLDAVDGGDVPVKQFVNSQTTT